MICHWVGMKRPVDFHPFWLAHTGLHGDAKIVRAAHAPGVYEPFARRRNFCNNGHDYRMQRSMENVGRSPSHDSSCWQFSPKWDIFQKSTINEKYYHRPTTALFIYVRRHHKIGHKTDGIYSCKSYFCHHKPFQKLHSRLQKLRKRL